MPQPNNQKKVEQMLKPRQVEWKSKRMLVPHCPVCKEPLSGNNSMITPYCCSCGEWQTEQLGGQFYFIIKTNPL